MKTSEKVNMHNQHWLTSTRFSLFRAPWTNLITKGICIQVQHCSKPTHDHAATTVLDQLALHSAVASYRTYIPHNEYISNKTSVDYYNATSRIDSTHLPHPLKIRALGPHYFKLPSDGPADIQPPFLGIIQFIASSIQFMNI